MRKFLASLIRLQVRFIAWQLQFAPALLKEYEREVTKQASADLTKRVIIARLMQYRRRGSRQ